LFETFVSKIMGSLVFESDSSGKAKKKSESGSSIRTAILDEEGTRRNIACLVEEIQKDHTNGQILEIIRRSTLDVQEKYEASHNGFRASRKHPDFINIDQYIAFFKGLKIFYDMIMPDVSSFSKEEKIGIGVIKPAIQDIGKDIIRMEWISEGYEVIDLEKNVSSQEFCEAIEHYNLDVIGISCMRNDCLSALEAFLGQLQTKCCKIPVIIGGVAVNPVVAYEFSEKYQVPVYYCKDVSQAEGILNRAIGNEPISIPTIITPELFKDSDEALSIANMNNFTLYQVPIERIVVDQHSRDGCKVCAQYKKVRCPLEIGYERQHSLEESMELITNFQFGVFVVTPKTESDERDNSDREDDKRRLRGLIAIESALNQRYGYAMAFKFPLVCPFCSPNDCSLAKGYCTMEKNYRPLHESYNINIPKTAQQILGENIKADLYSLILVGINSN